VKTKVHFCSDLHFNHANIILYANRPYSSVEEMNESLIDNWNAVVKPEHIVYILGDFAFAKQDVIKKFAIRLNGTKHLVMGNHDKLIRNNQDAFINKNKGDNFFSSIQEYKEININGQHICLFHFAMRSWHRSHHGSYALFGHSHGSLEPLGKSVDVGVDAKFITDEYRPVSFEEVKYFMDKRDIEIVDHHKPNTNDHNHDND